MARDRLDYLRDPAAIYRQSFATARAECDLSGLPEDLGEIALRLVHACGMPEIVPDVRASADFAAAGRAALAAGAPILVDAQMVAAGIVARRLPLANPVACLLDDPQCAERAAALGTTRSAAAVDLAGPRLEGALLVLGNAPTALFRLLELQDAGAPKPAAVVGLPVGFVGAAESKAALHADPRGLPYLTLLGRRGGSAMAAAAVNALAFGLGAP
jgi:precorrin-8X/cobalt-precorrin-8 methylmutase